jgi:hypothetical protein
MVSARSGKVELYSNLLEELGSNPLPYEGPPEIPAMTPTFLDLKSKPDQN